MTKDAFAVDLRVTEDRLAVLLDCTLPKDNLTPLLEHIEESLKKLGVTPIPERATLTKLLQEAVDQGDHIENLILLKGEPPVPSKDAVINWTQDFFNASFAVDEATGAIDYRSRLAQPQVTEGQLLAEVIPAQEGKAGCDVFGKRIPVRKPRKVRIKSGQNVRRDQTGDKFYAVSDGRIRWEAGGLAVDTTYTIQGSVGLETGHVHHPGAVIIEEDVLSESEIQADGDIDVGGVIEAAAIEVGGRLSVRGGITSAKGGYIKVSSSIHAKFILDAQVEAGDDIVIEREIIHSDVKTRGAVRMPQGRLVGGNTVALGGIEVGQAGSDAVVRTTLIVGQDYRIRPMVAERETQIKALTKQIEKIRINVEPYKFRLDDLPPDRKEAVSKLLEKAAEMRKTRDELKEEIEELQAESQERAKPEIVVRNILYPDTILGIGKAKLRVRETLRTPIRAVMRHGDVVLENADDP